MRPHHPHGGPRRGPGPGAPAGPETPVPFDLAAWLAGRIPADWFTGPVELTVDRDEITIVGPLADPELPADAGDSAVGLARAGRAREFRERTRDARIGVASELEHATERKVAWGVRVGTETVLFTNAAVPVMTRLRQPERLILDTLVEAGVARSRSEALAWCVRLVGRNSDEWLASLRNALDDVAKVRGEGPQA
jgi:hypothetical protein